MFAKLSTLALALPLVSALTLTTPNGWTTGNQVTITWTATTTDAPFFSLELTNANFNKAYAIANNIATAQGTLTITLPQVLAGDGYTLEAIETNNVNVVYSQTGDFAIGTATTTSASTASTTSASSVSSMSSGSSTSIPVTMTTPSASVSTLPVVSGTTATSASATPSSFNSGAASFKLASGAAPAAAMVLVAIAGAAVVF